jgi:hypothetical protein
MLDLLNCVGVKITPSIVSLAKLTFLLKFILSRAVYTLIALL